MRPSASQIEAAVERLKAAPGQFQRLAEEVARILYGDRFRSIVGYGRSTADVALQGWPDAYAIRADGRIDAIEVTHSERWDAHLAEDIRKARERLGSGRLGGFVFVAWAHNPPSHKFLRARETIENLGVQPEDIDFIFRERLVSILSEPRFAAIRLDLLGIRTNCFPFKVVEEADHLFGDSLSDLFAPARDEFTHGLVHRPAILGSVEETLYQHGWALIKGLGASGKTTLALHLALSAQYGSARSFYLDLSEGEQSGEVALSDALDVVATFADNGVIFIIDNVHLNQAIARSIYDQWYSFPNQSKLLLLSRLISLGPSTRGTRSPLGDLERTALILEPTEDDIAGVYQRLGRRSLGGAAPPTPPDAILSSWRDMFGGDLIAFSGALALRLGRQGIRDLARSGWPLTMEDATIYVSEHYVEPERKRGDLGSLLRIAAAATIELDIPENALEPSALAYSLRQGIVQRVERGQERYRRLRLIHPRLGNLILAATKQKQNDIDLILNEIGHSSPFFAFTAAARLESLGQASKAQALLTALARDPVFLRQGLIVIPISYGATSAQRLERLSVMPAEATDEVLMQDDESIAALHASCLRSPLNSLAAFLGYAERKLPAVHRRLAADLASDESITALHATCLRSPVGDLAAFLGYAERKLPAVHRRLAADLASDESITALHATCLQAPLHFLAAFLGYAERKLPAVHRRLAADLASDESITALHASCLRSPVGDLAAFLGYAERALPAVHRRLAADLASDESITALHASCLRSPVGDLAAFLGYAERALPAVHRRLPADLASDESITALHATCLRSPVGDLATFLGYAERKLPAVHRRLPADLASDESITALHASCLRSPVGDLAAFLGYAERALPAVHRRLAADLASDESISTLHATCLRSPVGDLATFLGYAERALPAVHRRLAADLASDESITALHATCLQAPLHFLAAFLGYAERKLPAVHRRLAADLASDESISTLHASCLRSPVGDLAAFLGYAERALPAVHRRLAADLASDESITALHASCLRSPVGDLAAFLGYAERALPAVHRRLAADLASDESITALHATCLQAPLDHLATFLEIGREVTPGIIASLELHLEEPQSVQNLAARLINEPLEKVIAFLRIPSVDFAQQILGAVSAKAWEESRGDLIGDLSLFPSATHIFYQLGRTDLLESLARKLINNTSGSHWHRKGIYLHHLSHVLRLGRDCSLEEKSRFLDKVMTGQWVYRQLSSDSAGRLAAGLFSIWTNLEPELHAKFRVLALQQRVSSEIAGMEKTGWKDLAMATDVLRLLGAAVLLGVMTRDIIVRKITSDQLNLIAWGAIFQESETNRAITVRDIQLCAGIYAIAQLKRGQILRLSATVGRRALDLFEDSTPPTLQAVQLRGDMIQWLRRCADAGWKILAD